MLPETEVSAQAAYTAAMDRITRMTQALVLSEGARLVLQQRVAAEEKRANDAEKQISVVKELMDRRTSTLRRRAEAAERALEGVNEDAENGEACDAGGEADTTQTFYD